MLNRSSDMESLGKNILVTIQVNLWLASNNLIGYNTNEPFLHERNSSTRSSLEPLIEQRNKHSKTKTIKERNNYSVPIAPLIFEPNNVIIRAITNQEFSLNPELRPVRGQETSRWFLVDSDVWRGRSFDIYILYLYFIFLILLYY